MTTTLTNDLARIKDTLTKASVLAKTFTPDNVTVQDKANNDPVTEADTAINDLLYSSLLQEGEGWLSEETADDGERLGKSKIWIIDPIDGTREFIQGLPEWVVSVGLVENGKPVAAGILNPLADEIFLGIEGGGVTVNDKRVHVADKGSLDGAKVLASRSELRDGRWEPLKSSPIEIIPTGSIAFKLALVAAGRVDATISLAPKNEWDIAAGILLVQAAGGRVTDLNGDPIPFNQKDTLRNGVIAAGPKTFDLLTQLLEGVQ